MTLVNSVLGIVPGLQATALVGYNLKMLPDFNIKPSRKIGKIGNTRMNNMRMNKMDMKPIKNIVKAGVVTMVGVALIKPTASMINAL